MTRPTSLAHSGALAYLVVTLFDQAAREEREAVRQIATDAEALLCGSRRAARGADLEARGPAGAAVSAGQAPRAKALAKLLRDGRVRRERRGTSTVLVA